MLKLTTLFLILGVAFVTLGLTIAYIVPEILSKQDVAFQDWMAAHAADLSLPANSAMAKDFLRLRGRINRCGGMYPGWPQAILPCALGLSFLATSRYYFTRKLKPISNGTAG